MRKLSRILQPIAWISFTYSACLINLRSSDNTPIFIALALLVFALVVTWKSYAD